MEILYLSASPIPSQKANSVHVMKMCSSFSINHKVKLYCIGKKNNQDVFELYRVNKKFDIKYFSWPKIKYLAGFIYGHAIKKDIKKEMKTRKKDFPIIYGRDKYSIFLMRKHQGQIYYESHKKPNGFLAKFIERKIFTTKNFKKLVVISEQLKSEYLRIFRFLKSNQIIVAHDACDIQQNTDVDTFKETNLANIGYVGSLYPGKGMEIISKLSFLLPDRTFHVIGGMNDQINFWRNKSGDNVIFHGFITQNKLFEFYSKFDIALAPYQNDVYTAMKRNNNISKWMSPLKLFEYMAHGKIIVSSNLEVLQEVLTDKFNAMLCNPNDINQWLKAILEISENPELCFKLRLNGYNEFTHKYTWDKRAELVIQ